jgi:hypothetical protein
VDVPSPREDSLVDLHDGPHHHELPVRPQSGDTAEQVDVEPLVDHADESQPRTFDRTLGLRFDHRLPRLGEVRYVDAAREEVHVAVPVALGLEEAPPAREDEVGLAKQLFLRAEHLRGCACEGRELVHAVVDHRPWLELLRDPHGHRRVEPKDVVVDAMLLQQLQQQLLLSRRRLALGKVARNVRHGDGQPVGGPRFHSQVIPTDWLLHEENPPIAGATAQ